MQAKSTPTTKVCTKCNVEKDHESFPNDPRYQGGRSTWCRECKREYARAWRQKNADRERERHRRAYAADPEQRRAAVRRSNQKHRDARLAYARAYHRQHSQKIAAYGHQRRQAGGAARLLSEREQQARLRLSKYPVKIERLDYAAILERDGFHCHICDQPIIPQTIKAIEFDHIVPPEHGGGHLADNVAVSHVSCNKRKWKTLLDDSVKQS